MKTLDREAILARKNAGDSIEQIAASLGVSARRVYQVIGAQKTKPRVNDDEAAEIRRQYALNFSIREIAGKMSKSRKTVTDVLRAGGIDPEKKNQEFTPEELAFIRDRAKHGRSPAEIARDLKREPGGVRAALSRMEEEAARHDWIQEIVIARAIEKKMHTGYALAKATGQAASEEHLKGYLERRNSLSSRILQHVFRALELGVVSVGK